MNPILMVGLMILIGHLAYLGFQKTKIPDVLILTLVGLVLGPTGSGWIEKSQFGIVGSNLTTIALVVILFEGGLGLQLKSLVQSLKGSSLITIATFVITSVVVAVMTRAMLDSWLLAAALGVTLGGTSSAVVIPLSQALPIEEKTKTVLFLESALTDVLCIVLVFGLLAGYKSGEISPIGLTFEILSLFLFSALGGLVAGAFWAWFLKKVRQFPHTFFSSLTFVFIVYGVVETMRLNGAIAVLVLGVLLGNLKDLPIEKVHWLKREDFAHILDFERTLFSETVFLLKIFFFFYLGISIQLREVSLITLGLAITLAVFGVRLLTTRIFLPRSHEKYDASIVMTMVPKGLAAAVLAGLPLQMGIEKGAMIQDTAYSVILFSIITTSVLVALQGWAPLRRTLDLFFSGFGSKDIR